jgi:hypothetical protein
MRERLRDMTRDRGPEPERRAERALEVMIEHALEERGLSLRGDLDPLNEIEPRRGHPLVGHERGAWNVEREAAQGQDEVAFMP